MRSTTDCTDNTDFEGEDIRILNFTLGTGSTGKMSEEAMGIIEARNLSFHAGNALIAILDGDLEKAAFHIGREQLVSAPPKGGTPNRIANRIVNRANPAVALLLAPEKKRGSANGTGAKRGRPRKVEPDIIPVIDVGQGVPVLKRGEKRKCSKCGAEKGCTGFKRGSLVCTACAGGSQFNPPNVGEPSIRRTCTACGKKLHINAFENGAERCRKCAKNDTTAPREIFQNTRVTDRKSEIETRMAARYRKCDKCKASRGLRAFDGDATVCRQCANPDLN